MYILLLEDDEDMLFTLGEALEMEGHIVTYARSGIEGLQKLEERLPDLVISDLKMPGMDGIDFVQAVRRSETWSALPIVMMSGAPADRDKAIAAGANDFLVKPFRFPELEAVLSRMK